MKLFQKIFLILISSIFIISCCPSLKTINKTEPANIIKVNSPIEYKDNTAIYRARINAFGNYFSGLIFFKKINSISYHIVFISELGLTIMSIKMNEDDFIMTYCPEQLNKKIFIKQLEKDMRLLLLNYPVFSDNNFKGIMKKKEKGKIHTKNKCFIFNFNEKGNIDSYFIKKLFGFKSIINKNNESIVILHKFPKYSIELTKIQKK